jgi:hypothetical protein
VVGNNNGTVLSLFNNGTAQKRPLSAWNCGWGEL